MNCKNCQSELSDNDQYCSKCGAHVVSKRINTKSLLNEFLYNFFGWDNSFLKTLRDMVKQPYRVIRDYLDGVRKRYVSPFIFVAVGTGLAMIVFNALSDDYFEYQNNISKTLEEKQLELIKDELEIEEGSQQEKNFEDEYATYQNAEEIQKNILKYYNIFTFLLIPLYSFIAFLVFGKKLNYGEHLVVNCYILGLSFFISVILFVLSIYTSPYIFQVQVFVVIIYYLWSYAKLMNIGLGKTLLKFLLFLVVLIGLSIIIIIAGVIFTLITQYMK